MCRLHLLRFSCLSRFPSIAPTAQTLGPKGGFSHRQELIEMTRDETCFYLGEGKKKALRLLLDVGT